MHPLFEAEVHIRDYGDFAASKLASKIAWYLRNMIWKNCILVLPQDYEPDFFLGLCIVEGVEVPKDLVVVNGKVLSEFLDVHHTETNITLVLLE